MKITRNDILTIAKKPFNLVGEKKSDYINYSKWIKFIENHQEYFVWYEETKNGIETSKNINLVPEWAKERVLNSLNKRNVYVTNKLMKNPNDLVITYSDSDKRVHISLDKNLNKNSGKILLKMANHLDALLLKDGDEVIDEKIIQQL